MTNGQRARDKAAEAIAEDVSRCSEAERIEQAGNAISNALDGGAGR